MKHLLLLSLLLFPTLSSAAGKLQDNKAIQPAITEATAYLKQELTSELKQSVGLDEFILKVELKIDDKKLQTALGVDEQDWNKLQDMTLPGLFVEGKEEYSQSPLTQAKKEDILMSLKGIKVDLIYYQTNYTPEFLNSAVKKLITFTLPQLKAEQIEIVPKKEDAPFHTGRINSEETLAKALKGPLDVNVHKTEFQLFWDQYHKFLLLAAAFLILAASYYFSFALKGSLSNLTDTIKNKTFSQGQKSEATSALKSPEAIRPSTGDTFESYLEASEYLSSMVTREAKVFNEVVIMKLLAEDFVSLTILLDVLPKEKREMFLANIDADKKERFKAFIVEQGTSLLKDEAQLKHEVVKMIKLVKVASLSPDELYEIVISDLMNTLSVPELSGLMKISSTEEKSFICDQLDSEHLALLVQSEALSPEEIEFEAPTLTRSDMADLLIKASGVRGHKKTKIRKEKLESVYAQVETTKAEVLADAMGLAPTLRFEYLFTTFQKPALEYLEALDFENLSMLFPLLTQTMQTEVLAHLPQLLAERLQFARKKITTESLKIKGNFYFHLRTLTDEDTDHADPIKLVA